MFPYNYKKIDVDICWFELFLHSMISQSLDPAGL